MTTKSALYYARTGNSMRATIAIELAGIDVEKHEISLADKEQKQDWFMKINPAGAVPVFIHRKGTEGVVITQSGAILDYMVAAYRPDLWPDEDSQRAHCMVAMLAALSDVAVQNGIARQLAPISEDATKYVFERMCSSILATFSMMQGPFLFGDKKTIADYALFPVVYMREHALATMPEFKHIIDWLQQMKKDDAVLRAVEYSGIQLPA